MGAAALLVGFVLGSGTKENFLVSRCPCSSCSAPRCARGVRVRVVLIGLGWAVLVAGPIILSLEFLDVDVYQQPVAPRVRSAVLLQSLGRATPLHYATARALASRLAGASLLLLAPYLSQDVFYNGTLPTGTRYDFPALLA